MYGQSKFRHVVPICISLVAMLAGCASGNPDGYRVDQLLEPAASKAETPVSEHRVSLRELVENTRQAIRTGKNTEQLTVGRLTKITGYEWRPDLKDVILIGKKGSNQPPIPFSLFVETMRLAPYEVKMTLNPDPESNLERHELIYWPPALDGTRSLEIFTRADYTAKILASGIRPDSGILDWFPGAYEDLKSSVMGCGDFEELPINYGTSNIFFKPLRPAATAQKLPGTGGHIIMVNRSDVELAPGKQVEDPGVIKFARSYAPNAKRLAAILPVLRDLHDWYRLFLIAQFISADIDATGVKYPMLDFIMDEYEPKKRPIPPFLYGIPAQKIGRVCLEAFQEKTRIVQIAGGLRAGYRRFSIDAIFEGTKGATKAHLHKWNFGRASENAAEDGDIFDEKLRARIALMLDGVAASLYRKGRYRIVIRLLSEAIRLQPAKARLYNNRCLTLADLGKSSNAIADCNKALRFSPNNPTYLDTRGLVFLLLGNARRALDDLTSAIRQNEKSWESYLKRGLVHERLGSRSEANKDFEKAYSTAPDRQHVDSRLSQLRRLLERPVNQGK